MEDRITTVPELVAAEYCSAWQRWTLQPVERDDDRAGRDLYLHHLDDPQAGAGLVIYRWLDPDPDVAHQLLLPVDVAVTYAGARWDQRLQRLHDSL